MWAGKESCIDGFYNYWIRSGSYFGIFGRLGYWEFGGVYFWSCVSRSNFLFVLFLLWHFTLIAGNFSCSYFPSDKNFCKWLLGWYSSRPRYLGGNIESAEANGEYCLTYVVVFVSEILWCMLCEINLFKLQLPRHLVYAIMTSLQYHRVARLFESLHGGPPAKKNKNRKTSHPLFENILSRSLVHIYAA